MWLCGEGLGWGLNFLFSFNIHQTRTNRKHTFLYFSNGDTRFARFWGKSAGFIMLKNDANSSRSFFNSFHFTIQAWYHPFPGWLNLYRAWNSLKLTGRLAFFPTHVYLILSNKIKSLIQNIANGVQWSDNQRKIYFTQPTGTTNHLKWFYVICQM